MGRFFLSTVPALVFGFDWSLELSNIDTNQPLVLEFESGLAPAEIVLPIDSVNTSVVCEYYMWGAYPGTFNGMVLEEGCDADLVYAEIAGICTAPCEQSSDCPLNHILTCDQGLCLLADPWELW